MSRMPAVERDRALAHVVLRLTLGVNLAVHGLVRLPKLTAFADGLKGAFAETPLPGDLVWAFAVALVVAEAVVGALLVLGLFSRWTLVAGGLLMTSLVFGTALREDWATLGTQMLYALIYYVALRDLRHDRYSVDAWRQSRSASRSSS